MEPKCTSSLTEAAVPVFVAPTERGLPQVDQLARRGFFKSKEHEAFTTRFLKAEDSKIPCKL